ncbi:hypothetical protein NE237_032982 [Protea cynaroides]|uniref:Secreted protein n=1 Tax=Protea cynaroides TaxID=273540 RepID=A0A9Q0L4L5_9MAGN|nr:hypothetical protein NE237_032982 [Protea cynaroides]
MLQFSITLFLAVFTLSLQAAKVVVWSFLESPTLLVHVCADVPTCSLVRPVHFVTAKSCYSFILFFPTFHSMVSFAHDDHAGLWVHLLQLHWWYDADPCSFVYSSGLLLEGASLSLHYVVLHQRCYCTVPLCLCFFLESLLISSYFLVVPFVSFQPGFYYHQFWCWKYLWPVIIAFCVSRK